MNLKRNITIAAVTAVATIASAGLGSSPAIAGPATHQANTTITSAPRPNVLTWRQCWAGTYAMYREDGYSIQNSATAADLTCGSSPHKY
jgi:hypothetical protein